MQAVTADTLGMWALQYLNASPVQAARCSGVPWAKPGVDVASRAATISVVRNLVMTLSFGFRWLRTAVDQVARRSVPRDRPVDCDAGHAAGGGEWRVANSEGRRLGGCGCSRSPIRHSPPS